MTIIKAQNWVEYNARTRGGRLACIDVASGRRFTWAETGERTRRLAGVLAGDLGIGRGDRVLLLAHNSTDYLEVVFACAALGAVAVPVNWRLSEREIKYIWDDCQPRLVVHDDATQEVATACVDSDRRARRLSWGESYMAAYEPAIADATPFRSWPALDHDDPLMILYTSGTTGHPKGAIVTHGMIYWNMVNQLGFARFGPDMVNLVFLPLFHVGGLNLYATPAVYFGGCNVVMAGFDAGAALDALGDPDLGVTHVVGVPANYQMISQEPGFGQATFPSLVCAGVGGSPTPNPLIERWLTKGVALQQVYGMTETSPTVLALTAEDAATRIGSAGQRAMHTEVRVVGDDGSPVPPGETGELWVRGPNVTPGYWGNPEATRQAFTDGWLRTGDAGRCDADGFYYIVDRWKDMYITGGENVYPSEVENVLYELDAVAEAAVVGVPDERWVEAGRAYVVVKEGSDLSEGAILEHCRANLASFKVPRSVAFLDALPRNATGKVLKRGLRDRFVSS